MAEPAEDPAEGEEEEVKETVPEVLTLGLFFPNDKLSDCTIKLPEKGEEEGEEEKKEEEEVRRNDLVKMVDVGYENLDNRTLH
jgi:hypothetical protein